MKVQVAVVGGGLAGLSCALSLQNKGHEVLLLERNSQLGGRVASEVVDGYILDRGFQVLLTGYPAAQRWLDYLALDLRVFPAGSVIRKDQVWHHFGDPIRHPSALWRTLTAPIGSFADKLRVAWLRVCLLLNSVHPPAEMSTFDFLRGWGFSRDMIEDFFAPFFGGVFLEDHLSTSAAKFAKLFHLFSISSAAVPAAGMGAIPAQLGRRLKQAPLLNTEVEAVEGGRLITSNGDIEARAVVLAGGPQESLVTGKNTRYHATETFYFSCWGEEAVGRSLRLNAGRGAINCIAPLSGVAPYAPSGRSLVAVSTRGTRRSPEAIRAELTEMLPQDWEFVKSFYLPEALPIEENDLGRPARLKEHLFACGDHRQSGSIQGALASGERAAQAVHEFL